MYRHRLGKREKRQSERKRRIEERG